MYTALAHLLELKYLDESDVGGLLAEALTADVKTVLADETGLVGADAAVYGVSSYALPHVRARIPCIAPPRPSSSISPAYVPLSKSCVFGRIDRGLGLDIPLAGALAVGPWAGVPDTLVRHDCGSYVNDEQGVVFWRARALVVDWSIVVGIEA